MKFALCVAWLGSTVAFATPQMPDCDVLVKKCLAAGFVNDTKSGPEKNVWMGCVNKVAAGKTVAKVDATAAQAQLCLDSVKAQYKGHGH